MKKGEKTIGEQNLSLLKNEKKERTKICRHRN